MFDDLQNLQKKCADIMLKGNLQINEETGNLTFDVTEEEKDVFVEFAVNSILYSALVSLEERIDKSPEE